MMAGSDIGKAGGELPDALLLQASDWHMRLTDAPDDLELRAWFERWLESNASHRNAWALLERSVGLTRQTPPAYAADWQMAGQALPPLDAPSPRPPRARSSRKQAIRRATIGAVAAALVAVVAAPQIALHLRADQTTGTAQSRDIALEDGSQIALGAQSAITQNFGKGYRRVGLLAGEAFFDVVHDAARPFSVQAADMTVTVTGTAFDVSMTQETLSVSVTRGSVRVARPGGSPLTVALKPGQRLSIDRESGNSATLAVSPIEIGAWRSGRLAVRNASVADVAELLGRHFPGRIFLRDDALTSARVTGVYDLVDPVGSLQTLLSSSGAKMIWITPWIIIVTPA